MKLSKNAKESWSAIKVKVLKGELDYTRDEKLQIQEVYAELTGYVAQVDGCQACLRDVIQCLINNYEASKIIRG
jgi:uncharacterized metal-binding protein YceD (DUF177 family)